MRFELELEPHRNPKMMFRAIVVSDKIGKELGRHADVKFRSRQATEKMLGVLNFHQLRELYCYLVERFVPSWEKDNHKLPKGTEDPIYFRELILSPIVLSGFVISLLIVTQDPFSKVSLT